MLDFLLLFIKSRPMRNISYLTYTHIHFLKLERWNFKDLRYYSDHNSLSLMIILQSFNIVKNTFQ